MIGASLVFGVLLGQALSSFGAVVTNPLLASNRTFDYIILGGGLAGLTVKMSCAGILLLSVIFHALL